MKHFAKLMEVFLNYGYQETTEDDQFNLVIKATGKKRKKSTQNPLVTTYNQTIPNLKKKL